MIFDLKRINKKPFYKTRVFYALIIILLSMPILFAVSNLFDTGIEIYSLKIITDHDISLADNKVPEFNYQFSHVRGSLYVNTSDFRVHVLQEYFQRYKSPLTPFAADFISACDKYQAPADCTTIPAIAFVETRLCTVGSGDDLKNCWGFGGSGKNRIVFNTYNEAIDFVTRTMVANYGNYYLQNPKLMQYVYCGPNCHKWGPGVQSSRLEISRISQQLGYPKLI